MTARLTHNTRLRSAVLAHVQAHGPIDSQSIANHLGEARKAVSVSIGKLTASGHIHLVDQHGAPTQKHKAATRLYAPKPQASIATAPMPRNAQGSWDGKARGLNWAQSTLRPGCQDFLAVPSLRGEERHPHRPSIGIN